jgi:hypothetical protein
MGDPSHVPCLQRWFTLVRNGRFDDVPAEDIMIAIGGVPLIAGHEHDRALADRLLDLVKAGLRNRP